MLLAQIQPGNEAETFAFIIGVSIAILISGGIPFFTGVAMKQSALAIIGGLVSAAAGGLTGCCGGIPVALVFTVIIIVVAQNSGGRRERSRVADSDGYDYDEYGRAFRLATRDNGPGTSSRDDDQRRETDRDRRRESDDDFDRRAEQDDRYRKRGFRPRQRDNDPDD